MFTSKKNRDSALLIFMALVMLVFMLYIFFPSKKTPGKTEKDPVKIKNGKKISIPVDPDEKETANPDVFRGLRGVLTDYFNGVNNGDRPVSLIPSAEIESELRSSLEESHAPEINRALKYRLRDLNRAIDVFRDSGLSDEQKFDLYIGLFLIKSADEDILGRCLNFTSDEVQALLDLSFYKLIGNEATENYHAVPVIHYADLLAAKSDIFSPGEEVFKFSNALKDISDISPMQQINSVRDLFGYSTELRNYSFSWVEKDALDPDDRGDYKNVTVRRRKFFRLQYLIFPDPGKGGDPTWIRDLLKSDGGSFELSDMSVSDETPGENYAARSLIYSESTSRFIIIMDSPSPVSERGYVSLMFRTKMDRINTENNVINFSEKLYSKKEFRNRLEKFGRFLYRIRSVY